MREGGLLTFQEACAATRRFIDRNRPKPAAAETARGLDSIRLDERNIERMRAIFFHLACDKATSHCNAAPGLTELRAMAIQEQALRDAADMIASRIRVGLEREARVNPPKEQKSAPG